MTDNVVLEAIQKYLQDNVAPKIKLRAPADAKISNYELVHPNVFIGWIPPPNQLNDVAQVLMDGSKTALPAMLVGFDDGEDTGEETEMNIRINFGVYNPGDKMPDGKILPHFKGYQDLVNLIFLTRSELAKHPVIEGGKTIAYKPFKWGMCIDTPFPYWWGWLSFKVSGVVLRSQLLNDNNF